VALGAARPAPAGDDAAEAQRRFEREQLISRAREGVNPSNREAGGLEDLEAWLQKRHDRFREIAAKDQTAARELHEAEIILGAGKTDEGLIRQGAVLYRWLAGQVDASRGERPPELELVDDGHKPPTREPWPAAKVAEAVRKAAEAAAAGKPPAGGAAPKPFDYLDEKDRKLILQDRLDVARTPEGDVALRGIDALRRQEQIARGRGPAPATPSASPYDVPPLTDLCLTGPDELDLGICRAWVEARERQVAPRVRAYQADVPAPGLIGEGTLREKQARAQRYRDEVAALEKARASTEAALDRMVQVERRLTEVAGRLGFDIEEARGHLKTLEHRAAAAAAPGKEGAKPGEAKPGPDGSAKPGEEKPDTTKPPKEEPGKEKPGKEKPAKDETPDGGTGPAAGDGAQAAPPTPEELEEAHRVVDRLELSEVVGAQRLRLLWITVRRADERLRLYAEAIRQAQDEEASARTAAQHYEVELNRVRREHQLDGLLSEEARLTTKLAQAEAHAKGEPAGDHGLWQAYAGLLRDLIDVNRATRGAVGLRRELEQRSKPPRVEQAPASSATPAAEGSADPIQRWRDPRNALRDAKDAADALAALSEPGWTPELVAEHFRVVDERIQALAGALEVVRGVPDLKARETDAAGRTRLGLEKLTRLLESGAGTFKTRRDLRYWNRLRQRDLVKDESAFHETLKGIEDMRRKVREDMAVFERYRARLMDLGSLSFAIRVHRTLDGERLGAAWDDVRGAAARTGRWLALEGDENAGTFVAGTWTALLACLGVLAGSLLLVRFGRRALDHVLRRMATRVPALRAEPVTVRAEEAQKRREQAMQEAAARAAEEEALREVSADQAAMPQRMGEGGYGGDDE
jgi:hypothetical protein